ncbi:Hsp70 family protein [Dactylosporangium sp. McL0621]|uniref:Hsp70 family protein n=1 Tax=Dactylosporangium sp. McL0621 TaxID=3415678 RepID=UPI003CF03045
MALLLLRVADLHLGIDYGTSNTVAVLRWPDGRSRPLLFDSSPLLPSAVFATVDGRLLVGRDAERAARNDPARFEPNPKRRIDELDLLLGDRVFAVAELVAAVLERVGIEARRIADGPVDRVTLTHPVAWGPTRRKVLMDAAQRAGLPAPVLLAEPVAAAAYFTTVLGNRVGVGQSVVVYDLGAGTFDVSVVQRTGDGFETLAYRGFDDIGGLDLDALVVSHVGAVLADSAPQVWRTLDDPTNADDRRHRLQLWQDAREAREILTRESTAMIYVAAAQRDVILTREEFERAATDVLNRTIATTLATVREARVRPDSVAGWFLVGGATRTPLVATMLHRATDQPATAIEEPQLVVADGAVHSTSAEPVNGTIPAVASRQTQPPSDAADHPHQPSALAPALEAAVASTAMAAASVDDWTTRPVIAAEITVNTPQDAGLNTGTSPTETPLADNIATGDTSAVAQVLRADISDVPTPPRGLSDISRRIRQPGPLRSRRWLVAGLAAIVVVLALTSLPFLTRPGDATGGGSGHPSGSAHPAGSVSPSSPSQPAGAPGSSSPTIRTLTATLTGHTESVESVAFSPDGRILATASLDNTARLWNITDPTHPTPTATLTGHTNNVFSVAFSPDGRTLATASLDNTARLWNITDPTHPTPTATLTQTDSVTSVAFSPDGRTLATVTYHDTARLWNITDPTHPTPAATLTGTVTSVAFSPDGRTLATVANLDANARLWNITDPTHPTPIATLAHTDWVDSVAFSPDGRTLATVLRDKDNTAGLWNITDPTHPTPIATLAHTDMVSSVAFSPDGRTLATASYDKTARLWNITDPTQPTITTTLTGHTSIVESVAFSPDGRTLATASNDSTVKLWR